MWLVICSVADRSLDDNVSDNEVFNSAIPSPSFLIGRSTTRMRRATVGCTLSTGLQPCYSTGDLPSLVDQETTRKSRPKTFFPCTGNELMNWEQLQKSDSSDLSEPEARAGVVQSLLDVVICDFCDTKYNSWFDVDCILFIHSFIQCILVNG